VQERIRVLDARRCIQRKQINPDKAHRGKINSLKPLNINQTNNKLTGFITTGDDKKVRVWSIEGDLWGIIDLCQENFTAKSWNFPYNWQQSKKDQMYEVKKALSQMKKK